VNRKNDDWSASDLISPGGGCETEETYEYTRERGECERRYAGEHVFALQGTDFSQSGVFGPCSDRDLMSEAR
jgi:hypothetical protein